MYEKSNLVYSGIAINIIGYYFISMKTISLKLPGNLLDLLEKEARERRTTKSSLVRECLQKELSPDFGNKENSCFDLACDLAGSLNALPEDLATNPKYMEEFGR